MPFLPSPPPQAVAIVGTRLALHYEDPQEKAAFEDLVTDAEWGITLGKLGVSPFAEIFRFGIKDYGVILATSVPPPPLQGFAETALRAPLSGAKNKIDGRCCCVHLWFWLPQRNRGGKGEPRVPIDPCVKNWRPEIYRLENRSP